jgi:hypothetical protein
MIRAEKLTVIPAKAGTHLPDDPQTRRCRCGQGWSWVPAFAGMT